jgi:hypothetical protein
MLELNNHNLGQRFRHVDMVAIFLRVGDAHPDSKIPDQKIWALIGPTLGQYLIKALVRGESAREGKSLIDNPEIVRARFYLQMIVTPDRHRTNE